MPDLRRPGRPRGGEIETPRREQLTGPVIVIRLAAPRSTVGLILRRLEPGRLAALVRTASPRLWQEPGTGFQP